METHKFFIQTLMSKVVHDDFFYRCVQTSKSDNNTNLLLSNLVILKDFLLFLITLNVQYIPKSGHAFKNKKVKHLNFMN